MTKEEQQLYYSVIEKCGVDSRVALMNEECGELISALAKFPRGRSSRQDIMTELADVSIMCEQLALMLGWEEFCQERSKKLDRLRKRLTEGTL